MERYKIINHLTEIKGLLCRNKTSDGIESDVVISDAISYISELENRITTLETGYEKINQVMQELKCYDRHKEYPTGYGIITPSEILDIMTVIKEAHNDG